MSEYLVGKCLKSHSESEMRRAARLSIGVCWGENSLNRIKLLLSCSRGEGGVGKVTLFLSWGKIQPRCFFGRGRACCKGSNKISPLLLSQHGAQLTEKRSLAFFYDLTQNLCVNRVGRILFKLELLIEECDDLFLKCSDEKGSIKVVS